MRLDMTRDAKQLHVVGIVGQPLHLVRYVGVGILYGYLVVAVNAGGDVAVGQYACGYALSSASLAQASCPLVDDALNFGPTFGV
jgi:hypothetical protein